MGAKKIAVPAPAPAVPAPVPAVPAAIVKFLPAAPAAPSVQIIGPKVIYETVAAPAPAPAPVPVVKAAPAPAPAAAPAVAPVKATYYEADDDGELDKLDVAYVSYGAKPRAAVAPVLAPASVPAAVPTVKVYSLANPSAGPVLLPIDLD